LSCAQQPELVATSTRKLPPVYNKHTCVAIQQMYRTSRTYTSANNQIISDNEWNLYNKKSTFKLNEYCSSISQCMDSSTCTVPALNLLNKTPWNTT